MSSYICGQSTVQLQVLPNWVIPLSFTGTPPFQLHTTVTPAAANGPTCNYHTKLTDLDTNSFYWTVILDNGTQSAGQVTIGNKTVPTFRIGDSVIFIATQRDSDNTTTRGTEYSSSYNYTITSPDRLQASASIPAKSASWPATAAMSWKAGLAFVLLGSSAVLLA